jgi:hypothetical protein
MNYLDLCQRLVRETGIADSGPTSVVGQTGDYRRITDWVNDAWLMIQSMRPDWAWMWATGTSTLTANTYLVTLPTTVESIERVSLGESYIQRLTYDELADAYREITAGEPSAFAIRPDGKLAFNAKPEENKTITYEYYKAPTSMTVNIDTPAMPSRYHMLIVYSALKDYASFDVAPELSAKAVVQYEQMLADLERDQLPKIQAAESLA